jgi:hypothetical protein
VATESARTTRGLLSTITKRRNIMWLDTDEEAIDYINANYHEA